MAGKPNLNETKGMATRRVPGSSRRRDEVVGVLAGVREARVRQESFTGVEGGGG